VTKVTKVDCFAHFDPNTRIVTFRGERYELQPVIDSISALWKNAETQIRRALAFPRNV
jgi:hypothetical protein